MKTSGKYSRKNYLQDYRYYSILFVIIPVLIFIILIDSCKEESCDYQVSSKSPCESGMDVAFLIDYTGSMGSVINSIKSSVNIIAGTIATESGGDYRLALSIFDENLDTVPPSYVSQTDYTSLAMAQRRIITSGPTHQYLTMMEIFGTANNVTFGSQLAKLNGSMYLGNGLGTPEPGGLLLNEILNNNFAGTWRTGVTKLAIIITDADDGGDDDVANATDDAYLANLAATANLMEVKCILVTSLSASNYASQLIDNNTDGIKLMSANFSTIPTSIITLIKQICDNHVIGILNILDNDCSNTYNTADAFGVGWTFNLKNSSGVVIQTSVTDINGNLFYSGLPDGTYTVEIVTQSGWTTQTPASGSITVNLSGNSSSIMEFYNCPN